MAVFRLKIFAFAGVAGVLLFVSFCYGAVGLAEQVFSAAAWLFLPPTLFFLICYQRMKRQSDLYFSDHFFLEEELVCLARLVFNRLLEVFFFFIPATAPRKYSMWESAQGNDFFVFHNRTSNIVFQNITNTVI